jgi:hypothetical protein
MAKKNEIQAVVEWRLEVLKDAGFDADAAELVAYRLDIDLELARRLLRAGCPPRKALEILL